MKDRIIYTWSSIRFGHECCFSIPVFLVVVIALVTPMEQTVVEVEEQLKKETTEEETVEEQVKNLVVDIPVEDCNYNL